MVSIASGRQTSSLDAKHMLIFSAIFSSGCRCFGSQVLQSVRRESFALSLFSISISISLISARVSQRKRRSILWRPDSLSLTQYYPYRYKTTVVPPQQQQQQQKQKKNPPAESFPPLPQRERCTIFLFACKTLPPPPLSVLLSVSLSPLLIFPSFQFGSSLFLCPYSWIESKEKVLLEHTLLEQRERRRRALSPLLLFLLSSFGSFRTSKPTTTTAVPLLPLLLLPTIQQEQYLLSLSPTKATDGPIPKAREREREERKENSRSLPVKKRVLQVTAIVCVIRSGGECCPAHPPATLSAFEFFHSLIWFSSVCSDHFGCSARRLWNTTHSFACSFFLFLSGSHSVHRPPPKQQPQTERTAKQQTTETSTFTNAAITTTTASKRLKRYHPLLFVPYKVSSAHFTCSILPQLFSVSTAQSPIDRGNALSLSGSPKTKPPGLGCCCRVVALLVLGKLSDCW